MSRVLAFALCRERPVTLRSEQGDGFNGLEEVLAYVASSAGDACIEPLDPTGAVIARGAFSALIAPDVGLEAESLTQAIHFLHLGANAPVERIKYLLARDERIAYVEELTIGSRAVDFETQGGANLEKQWAVEHCGFSTAAWKDLERDKPPGIVTVIDAGPATFKGKPIAGVREIALGNSPSSANHAAAVLSLIAPHADAATTCGYSGAVIDYYNVYEPTGINHKHWCTALAAASKTKTVAINMSFCEDIVAQCVADAIAACQMKGMLVVAAIGDPAAPFPAACKDVIAVVGTDNFDALSSKPPEGNVSLAAPSIDIDTILGPKTGTSFAAPMVTAAIWLARHRRQDLAVKEIRARVFASGVNPKGLPATQIGHGRIDIGCLRENLK